MGKKNTLQILQLSKIAIIGAGASGLISSIFLASKGFDVTILEKNNKVGKKLLATGNGRCNVTNQHINLNNFHSSSDISLIKNILNNFNYEKCKKFFNSIGIEFIHRENGRAYPMSQTASSIVDMLEYKALSCGVEIKLNYEVVKVIFDNEKFIINDSLKYNKVILSTGSLAMSKLGGTNQGYNIAKSFNHTLIDPFPSLVQLISDNKNLDMISGVKIDGTIENHQGDILFTKYGISGSAVLDISRDISYRLQYENNVKIKIDIMPNFSKNRLIEILTKRLKTLPNIDIYLWLDGIINKKLSRYIIEYSNITQNIKISQQLNKKDILKIVHSIKNLEFNITNTKGFDNCEVCGGGICLDEVNINTMESKLQKGLYLTGEILDVDADCGGYNLHFAWASGSTLAKELTI